MILERGGRESNPRNQFGRLRLYHQATSPGLCWKSSKTSGRLFKPDTTKPNAAPQCQMCKWPHDDLRLFCALTGCSSAWLERLLWEQEVAGSNPVTPTLQQLPADVALQNPIPQNQEYLDCEERRREPHPYAGQAQC